MRDKIRRTEKERGSRRKRGLWVVMKRIIRRNGS
jgi:hypothetical protein